MAIKVSFVSRFILFPLIIFAVLISCQRDIVYLGSYSNKSITINEAKSHFEKKIQKGYTAKNSSDHGEILNKEILWEDSRYKSISFGEAVIAPIYIKDAKVLIDEKTGEYFNFHNVNSLMMYKDESGAIQTEWVSLMPDRDWIAGNRSKYTGRIFVKDWDGNILKGYYYDKSGEITETKVNGNKSDTKNGKTSATVYSICVTIKVNCGGPAHITSPGLDSQANSSDGCFDTHCTSQTVVYEDPWGGASGTAGSGGVGNSQGFYSHFGGYGSSPGNGIDYVPVCDASIPPGTQVPPNQIPACEIYSYIAPDAIQIAPGIFYYPPSSPEPGLPNFDADPDAIWWDVLNIVYPEQALPSYVNFYAAYPKDPLDYTKEMKSKDVYALVGGDAYARYLSDTSLYRNACALRVSRALNYSGVTIPNIASHTIKGGDNKYYFLSAAKLYSWMNSVFKDPTKRIDLGPDQMNNHPAYNYSSLFQGKKGIYIMKPNMPGRAYFNASGHCTIYNGFNCQSNNCYFSALGGVNKITLWILE